MVFMASEVAGCAPKRGLLSRRWWGLDIGHGAEIV